MDNGKCQNSSGFLNGVISGWARRQTLVMVIALALAIVLPIIITQRYIVTVMTNFTVYGILALSLNLITGVMGITSMGHAAFFGIGAYTAAVLSTRFGMGFFITILAAFLLSALAALLLGIPAMRVPSRYLAIITLGFCEIVRIIELNWMEVTNGPLGVSQIPFPNIFGYICSSVLSRYYVGLALLVITYYVINSIVNSKTGRAVISIRENEIASEAMGINTYYYKVLIFVISAAFAGLAGAFSAHYIAFVDPKAYSFEQSVLILSMVILGGMGNLTGSIIGAILLCIIPEILRDLMNYRQVLYGLVIIIMMVWRSEGILGKYNFNHIKQRSLLVKSDRQGEVSGNDNFKC